MPATCQSTLAQSMLRCLQSPSQLVSRAGKQSLHSCQLVLCLSTGSASPPAQEQASLILLPLVAGSTLKFHAKEYRPASLAASASERSLVDEPGTVQDSPEDAGRPAQPAAEPESASALARAISASSAGSAPAAKPKVKGPAKLMMELFPAGSKPNPAPPAEPSSTPAASAAPVAQARASQEAPKPAPPASWPQPSAAKPQPSAAKAPAQQPDSPPRQPSTPPARPSPSPQASAQQQQQPQAAPSQPAAAPALPAGLTFPSSSEPAAPSTPRLSQPPQPPQLTPSDAALVQAAHEALQGVLHAEVIVGTQQTVAEYHAEAAKSAFGVQVEHLQDPGAARAQPTALFLYDFSSRQLHGLWLSEPSHSKRFPSVRLP